MPSKLDEILELVEKNDPEALFELGRMYEYSDGSDGITKSYQQAFVYYKRAAEQWNSNAQNNLGLMFYNGSGVKQDYFLAEYLIRVAIRQNNKFAYANLAMMFYEGKAIVQDYAEAFRLYTLSASKGCNYARRLLASMYVDGLGTTKKDYTEARRLLNLAIEDGDELAQTQLSQIPEEEPAQAPIPLKIDADVKLEEIRDLAVNGDIKALKSQLSLWSKYLGYFLNATSLQRLETSAAKNNVAAMTILGVLYLDGSLVTRDYKCAFRWFNKATEHTRDKFCLKQLGHMYLYGLGVEKNILRAYSLYSDAEFFAELEDIVIVSGINALRTELNLSHRYLQFFHKPELIKLLEVAADKGSYSAMIVLGVMYLDGTLCVANYKEAYKWFIKVNEKIKDQFVLRKLAYMYEHGLGVAKDAKKASLLYKESGFFLQLENLVTDGNLDALENQLSLNYSYWNYIYTPASINWLRRYANQGEVAAIMVLGMLYMDGKIIKQNYKEALKRFEKANDVKKNKFILRCLGEIYDKGLGVDRDIQKALIYYLEAARYSDQTSIRWLKEQFEKYKNSKEHANKLISIKCAANLGDIYFLEKNYLKALPYLVTLDGVTGLSCDKTVLLAHMYNYALGVERNVREALRIYGQKYNDMHGYHYGKIAIIHLEGIGNADDIAKARSNFELGFKRNDRESSFFLAVMHQKGIGIEKNVTEALKYFNFCMQWEENSGYGYGQNLSKNLASYIIAELNLNNLDLVAHKIEAIRVITELSNEEYPVAISALGLMYENGLITGERDYVKAAELYQKAKSLYGKDNNKYNFAWLFTLPHVYTYRYADKLWKQGEIIFYAPNEYRLAKLYQHGLGVAQDITKAIELYSLAIKHEHVESYYELAILYKHGIHIEKSLVKSIELFTSAAELGDAKSQYELAMIHMVGGDEVPCNILLALSNLVKASELGYAPAKLELAKIYANGHGVIKPEPQKAISLLKEAVKLGDQEAQYQLACMYKKGVEVIPFADIYQLYKLAADKEHVLARYKLAKLYLNGHGVAKDINKAVKLYQETASKGHVKSLFRLSQLYRKGYPDLPVNIEVAERYLAEARAKGYFSETTVPAIAPPTETHAETHTEIGKPAEHATETVASGVPTVLSSRRALELGIQFMNGEGVGREVNIACKHFIQALDDDATCADAKMYLMALKDDSTPDIKEKIDRLFVSREYSRCTK